MTNNPGGKNLHIMFCPLNWGLGHAGRMIPLVQVFLDLGCRVTLVSDGLPLQMLQGEFGERVSYVEFAGPWIRYSRKKSQVWAIASLVPTITWWFFRERRFSRKLVSEYKPDMIISDNRYGIWSKKVFSVIVTHQLHIHMPATVKWLEKWINRVNHRVIRSFDLCMIPDFEKSPGLSGNLGHTRYHGPLIYSGALSRFSIPGNISQSKPLPYLPDEFILVLLSGPEPQRSLLEEELKIQLKNTSTVWFRGFPGRSEPLVSNNHVIFDHGSSALIGWCIRHAKLVICRSGYSSIMDLAVFGKKALMIPTPGQPEQEYLAVHLQEAGFIQTISQYQMGNLKEEITKAQNCTGLPQIPEGYATLQKFGNDLLNRLEQQKITDNH